MTPLRRLSRVLLAILCVGATDCYRSFTSEPTSDAAIGPPRVDAGSPDAALPPAPMSCEEVRAGCVDPEAVAVRGHAEGLVGVDGARVEFGVRYIAREFIGEGLFVPHHVARGTTTVRAGAFETCVCVPYNANLYPEIVGMVMASGAVGTLGGDAQRAYFSQRYATLGDEDLSMAFATPRDALIGEVASAALSERTVTVAVRGAAPVTGGIQVFAALLADGRPLAPELANAGLVAGTLTLSWVRPGPALPGERLVLVVDQDADGSCGVGDTATELPFDGRAEFSAVPGPWLVGAELSPICAALSVGSPRE